MRSPLVRRRALDEARERISELEDDLAYGIEGAELEARKKAFADYREWVVDLNFELYQAADSTLRSKVVAALVEATGRFDPKKVRDGD